MSRVLVVGRGPLPWQSVAQAGPGRRSWHVARALAGAGHRVLLLAVEDAGGADRIERHEREGITVWSLGEHAVHDQPEGLARHLDAHRAECVVAVSSMAAAIAVNHAGTLPLWSDLDGDPLADAQAASSHGQGNWRINEAYRTHVPVLMRSDRVSSRTHAHRAALIGQLGMVGRLIGENDGYEFVSVMPEVIDDAERGELRSVTRQLRAPAERFYLLWSGAFRAWADVDTLFEAVEMMMAEHAAFEFCAVGGPDTAAGPAYARLSHRASQSPFRARIDLPGWLSRDALLERYARADAAIFAERPSYQSTFGRRGRVTEWLGAGLPIVGTDLTETAADLRRAGVAHIVPTGAVIALRDALRRLVTDPEEALTMGLRGRRLAREDRSAETGLRPLVEWVGAPSRAPALEARVSLERHPSALRQHTATVRGHLETKGPAGTAMAAGRFAVRRVRRRALQVVDNMAKPPDGNP